jgi:hypothetical protein
MFSCMSVIWTLPNRVSTTYLSENVMVLCSVMLLLVITSIYNLAFILLLEKLIVSQLCRIFTKLYEPQSISPLFTTARQRTGFRATQHLTKNSTRISLSCITMPFPTVICSWVRSDICRLDLLIKLFVHRSYITAFYMSRASYSPGLDRSNIRCTRRTQNVQLLLMQYSTFLLLPSPLSGPHIFLKYIST